MARPRILFIRLGAIGDVVRTLPALSAVREQMPEAFLAWVVEERSLPILKGHPDLDEVLLLERDTLKREFSSPHTFFDALARAGGFGRALRRKEFGISLDFQGTFKSGLIALAAGAPLRAGYERAAVKEGNYLFQNRHVSLPHGSAHRVRRNFALLSSLGIQATPREVPVTLPISDQDRSEADRALRDAGALGRDYLFLYPGSSSRQRYKRYPAPRFGLVARSLIGSGREVVLGTGPGEEEIARAMVAAAGARLHVLPPTSLLALSEIIRRARIFVGGDTGPMHIAALQGVPVVALFGPTDPALNAPWGAGHIVLDALAGPPAATDGAVAPAADIGAVAPAALGASAPAADVGAVTPAPRGASAPAVAVPASPAGGASEGAPPAAPGSEGFRATRRRRDASVLDALEPERIVAAAIEILSRDPRSGPSLASRDAAPRATAGIRVDA